MIAWSAILGESGTKASTSASTSPWLGAVSWLHTFLPMLDMGSPPKELKHFGNEHRQVIPVNAYATADGHKVRISYGDS